MRSGATVKSCLKNKQKHSQKLSWYLWERDVCGVLEWEPWERVEIRIWLFNYRTFA